MNKKNPLNLLQRPDKWFLGGGNRLLWTPPFPLWLDSPGFWDKAHYYNLEIEPVFTWTLLDEEGKEIPLRAVSRDWDPSKLVTEFRNFPGAASRKKRSPPALTVVESKCVLPDDALVSSIILKNRGSGRRTVHLVAWTIQPNFPSHKETWITDLKREGSGIVFTKHIQSTAGVNRPHFSFECSLGISGKVRSFAVNLSEGSIIQPHWRFTSFVEQFRNLRLADDIRLGGVTEDGLVFIGLETEIRLGGKSETSISVGFSAAPTRAAASSALTILGKKLNLVEASRDNWAKSFAGVPSFTCTDEYFERYYWYRWYGLRLLTVDGQEGNYRHPAVCEGIGYFRAPISYSAMCHMLENQWRHDPSLAQGSLLTFIDNRRDDGGFRGYIDPHFYRQEMFYHANWGNSLRELDRLHPDDGFLSIVYDGLADYARYFDRERDEEKSGLYDIDNHYETGQEFMRRYTVVNSNADRDNWGEVFRLKGVDVTVYLYELKKMLADAGARLGKPDAEITSWREGAETIKTAILDKMWDPEAEMFFDVDPTTRQRTGVKTATSFYPYMTDIVSANHVAGLKRHLLNPEEFWTPYPVPASSRDDEMFSAEAEWKGKRMNCPWNGRVWPMTNSHIAEALARSALRFQDDDLRGAAVEFISKFVRMMFFDGDPRRPNCFEHYNPITGDPSIYRGVDDYQHSWVVDLIIKYVCGVRVEGATLVVDPFPFAMSGFAVRGLRIRGRRVDVERKGRKFTVRIDGRSAGSSILSVPIVVAES